MRRVDEIRADIDRCDERILEAFVTRARLVREVARVKIRAERPIFDADREREILERARLLGLHARSLMNQVLALCRLEIYDELEGVPKRKGAGEYDRASTGENAGAAVRR